MAVGRWGGHDEPGERVRIGSPLEHGPLTAATGPLVASPAETVTGVLEDAGGRSSVGRELSVSDRVRRWPWALGAALAGAVGGAAVAYVAGRLQVPDALGAQEPEQLQAVVDRPDPDPNPTP